MRTSLITQSSEVVGLVWLELSRSVDPLLDSQLLGLLVQLGPDDCQMGFSESLKNRR